MKKNKTLLVTALLVFVGLCITRDFLIKNIITSVASNMMGASVTMGGFSLGLFSKKIDIRDMKQYNPPGFPREVLIDFPQISVDYDLAALMKGKLHLPLIIVNLKEMVVVKNKEGKLNVDSLKVVEEQKNSKNKSKSMPMQIDLLQLTVGKVVFKDFTQGETPRIEVFDVAFKNKAFKNITSAQQLATLIMAQAMRQTAIKGAAIYGVSTLLGASFLPAGVVGFLVGKDDAASEFQQGFDKVYAAALEVARQMGKIRSEDKSAGIVKCVVKGADVAIKIEDQSSGRLVTISARQFMMPKPELAAGVLYQISEKLGKGK